VNLKTLFYDKKFYKAALRLAIPIAIQNLILSSLNLVDNIMIGKLGDSAIAGVGIANQLSFLMNLFLFGVVSGSSIFIAQYWGSRDTKNIKRILGLCLISGILVSFVFSIIGLAIPTKVLNIFIKDAEVVSLGSKYLRIVSLSYTVTAISFAFSFTLRSIGNVKLPLIVSTTALGVNTFLNYALIFGNYGFKALGVEGAAIATVIARLIEATVLIFVIYRNKYPIAGSLKEYLDLSSKFIGKFYNVTGPVIFNEGIWALGVTTYSLVYSRMGKEVLAATNISSTIERIAFVTFLGFGNACAVMIGNKIGAKKEETAFVYAIRFLLINTVLGIVVGLFIYIGAPHILSVYSVSETTLTYSRNILIVLSFSLWVKIFNYTNIVGILRSGGDTKFCLFLDTCGMWFVGIPLVALGGLYWGLPIHIVYIFVYMEEAAKLIIGLPRVLSKKWINNLVNHADASSVSVAPEVEAV
jgi:putative MATE family efflux protein